MTTFHLTVKFNWIEVVSALGLEVGVSYFIQNVSDTELAYSFSPTEPVGDDGKHTLLPSARKDFFIREDSKFWVKSKQVGDLNKYIKVTISSDCTIIATESNGGVPVNIQDQTTRPLMVKFNQIQNGTTLAQIAVKGNYDIEVSDSTGFIPGRHVIIFEPATDNFSFYEALAVVANTITLDTPLDFAYGIGAFVDGAITNLNQDGSITRQTFGLRGSPSPGEISLTADITRLIFKGITTTVASLDLFGDLPKLTRGLVLCKQNDIVENLFNVKDNGELVSIMYDWTFVSATNPAQGVNGFYGRLTFAGQNRIGVAIRLAPGEDLELIIQDDLTGLVVLEIIAEGHLLFM